MSAADEATKVEELSSDEDMPGLEAAEEVPADVGAAEEEGAGSKQTRAEKKSRKAISKLGLKQVTGIKRVVIKRSNNYLYVVNAPEVFKAPNAETYVIFGEPHQEDMSNNPMMNAARQFSAGGMPDLSGMGGEDEGPPELVSAEGGQVEEVEEEGEVDTSGLEDKDIELVMQQASVSKAKAVKALRKADGDIVNAIMELS